MSELSYLSDNDATGYSYLFRTISSIAPQSLGRSKPPLPLIYVHTSFPSFATTSLSLVTKPIGVVTRIASRLLLKQHDPFDEFDHKIVGHVILDVMPGMRLRKDDERYFRHC